MTTLTVAGKNYTCENNETVLEALLRANVAISYVCKMGSCQTCLVRSIHGTPPATAQSGLKATLKKQHYFLACRCYPTEDMTLKLSEQAEFYRDGVVVKHTLLNHNTLLLGIRFNDAFEFYAGQFVNLQRKDGLTRSYSIATIPQAHNIVEFHIRCLPHGRFSAWLRDELTLGDTIAVSEPRGHCFYVPERAEQNLLLIGTGTGLAPLEGILLDALAHQHTGNIYLFHGGREVNDLYHSSQLQTLAAQHDNFFYTPCLSGAQVPEGIAQGRAHEVALARFTDLSNWRVFLCGHPDMVNQMKRQAFMKGASMNDIYADAFFTAAH